MIRKKILLFLFCLLAVKGVSLLVDRGKIMTPEITVPYFSGAALIHNSGKWIFNLNEVDSIKKINAIIDPLERRNKLDSYHFSNRVQNEHTYQINQPGLLYAIIIAKKIFFMNGDIGALKSFQLLVHCLFCFLILLNFKSTNKKAIFFFLYFINPVVIYLTLFPFYYYWQVIGSYILILLIQNEKYQKTWVLFLTALLLACIYHIRISTLPLSLLILVFGFYKIPLIRRSIAFLVFAFSIYLMEPIYLAKHPGHVLYSSLGAYPGSPVSGFADNISFKNYSESIGKNLTYETNPSMYDPEVVMGEAKWGLNEFKSFAKKHPVIILRNATLNFFESYSFGYMTTSIFLTYFSAFLGLIFFIILLIREKYTHLILIFISTCSYIFYLAPVPIYLYGTFIISVYALIDLIPENHYKHWA